MMFNPIDTTQIVRQLEDKLQYILHLYQFVPKGGAAPVMINQIDYHGVITRD